MDCRIYGLGLRVNTAIAGLRGLQPADRIDVDLFLDEMPAELQAAVSASALEFFASPYLNEAGVPALRASTACDARYYHLQYSDGTSVVVEADGRAIWASTPEGATTEDTATYLLGPVLGFVLRLRGTTCLHASAVVVDGKGIALVGRSGAGKSSTAAAFARLGHPVLTDDVLALRDRGKVFDILPAYPRVRLWEESVEAMFGAPDALPRITPTWNKRYLDLNGHELRFQAEAVRMSALYFLGERQDEQADAEIRGVGAREGLLRIVADTYAGSLIGPAQRAAEFELLGRLVSSVPLREVRPSTDQGRIEGLCRQIVEDFRALPMGSA